MIDDFCAFFSSVITEALLKPLRRINGAQPFALNPIDRRRQAKAMVLEGYSCPLQDGRTGDEKAMTMTITRLNSG